MNRGIDEEIETETDLWKFCVCAVKRGKSASSICTEATRRNPFECPCSVFEERFEEQIEREPLGFFLFAFKY